jgi:hypothetical protein
MIDVRAVAALAILALTAATAAVADVAAVRDPPPFTRAEQDLIKGDRRLSEAAKVCPWSLRQALDIWDGIRRGSRLAVEPEPCRIAPTGPGRASDEGALDILKILKEAAGQGTSR